MTLLDEASMKYLKSVDGINACREITERDNPLDKSNYAPWIDIPTLARWLYGSSQEFLRDFKTSARKYEQECASEMSSTLDRKRQISALSNFLENDVENFRNNLLMVFGTTDKQLMEVLSA